MRSLLLFLLAFTITATVKAQCNAAGSASVSGNTVTVTNTSTPAATTNISTYYQYDWGDGTGLTYANNTTQQVHGYSVAGSYTIVLFQTVVDSTTTTPTTCSDSVWIGVNVTGKPCAVSIADSFQGGFTWKFTAKNLNNTPNMTYTWNFGDGNTATGSPVTHTYTTLGNFTVTLKSNNGSCSDSVAKVVKVSAMPCRVSITSSYQGNNLWNFSANNLNSAPSMTYTWDYGDGSTGTGSPVSHQYANGNNYNVTLRGTTTGCMDSAMTTVKGNNIPNYIAGNVIVDSSTTVDSYKVWLIKYDSATAILSAVDSTIVPAYLGAAPYMFNNIPAGTYRTKAALHNGATSGTGHVPTYHNSSLMWNTATVINHTGGTSLAKHIFMLKGTLTAGPGFIAGNVNQGANKGTANGIADLNVFLVNANGDAIAFSVTDANGYYSFSNVPLGTYTIAPENLNFATTAASLNITSGQTSYTGMHFERSLKNKVIFPVPSGIANVNTQSLEFVAYPNPAHDVVNINWGSLANETAQVTITDISGKTVFNTTASMNNNTQVNVNNLQPGLYFLNVTSDAGSNTQKLTIK